MSPSLVLRSHSLKLAVDFDKCCISGTSTFTVVLPLSPQEAEGLQRMQSGIEGGSVDVTVPLHMPSGPGFSVLGVSINDQPLPFPLKCLSSTMADFPEAVVKTGMGDKRDLLTLCEIASPILYSSATVITLAVPAQVLKSASQISAKRTISVILRISVDFEFVDPSPENHGIYFLEHVHLDFPDDQSLPSSTKLQQSIYLTTADSREPWFPTLLSDKLASSLCKKKSQLTTPFSMEVAVSPPGFALLTSLPFVQSQTRGDAEVFLYECRGVAPELTPNMVAVFGGNFLVLQDFCSLRAEQPDGESGSIEVPIRVAVPPHLEKCVPHTIQHMPSILLALKEIMQAYPIPYTSLTLAFLPRPHLQPHPVPRTDGGEDELEGTRQDSLNVFLRHHSPCAQWGPSYSVYGSLLVFPEEFLVSEDEAGEEVFQIHLEIIRAITATWVGGVVNVHPALVFVDYWLLLALRYYIADSIFILLFGKSKLGIDLTCRSETYYKMVVWGEDILPLSYDDVESSGSERPRTFAPGTTVLDVYHDPCYHLKASLILWALDQKLGHSEEEHRWIPPGTFSSFVLTYVRRAVCRGAGNLICTDDFFRRLETKLRQIFVTDGWWKLPHGALPHQPVKNGQAPKPDQLNLAAFRPFHHHNIEKLFVDLTEFRLCFLNRLGTTQVCVSLFIHLSKRGKSQERVIANVDQSPLSPPPAVTKEGASSWMWIARAAPRLFMNDFQDEDGLRQALAENSVQDLYATSGVPKLDEALKPHGRFPAFCCFDPVDVMTRDAKQGFGFGFVGLEATPICGGKGPLFYASLHRMTVEKAVTTLPGNHVPSGATASQLFVHRSAPPQDPFGLKIAPLTSSIGGQPEWFLPCTALILLRGLSLPLAAVDEPDRLGRLTVNCVTGLAVSSSVESFWPLTVKLEVCEEAGTSAAWLVLKTPYPRGLAADLMSEERTTVAATVPATEGAKPEDDASKVSAMLSARIASTRHLKQQFVGHLSTTDCDFLNNMELGMHAGVFDPLNRVEIARTLPEAGLPFLWVRNGAASGIGLLVRFRRCQSPGMWENQLENDPSPSMVLEAIEALSRIIQDTGTVRLVRLMRRHDFPPSVRGAAALGLVRIHNSISSSTNGDTEKMEFIMAALVDYFAVFVYEKPLSRMFLVSDRDVQNLLVSQPNLNRPYFLSERLFIMHLYNGLSLLRGRDGLTPPGALRLVLSIIQEVQAEKSDRGVHTRFTSQILSILADAALPEIPRFCPESNPDARAPEVVDFLFSHVWRLYRLDICFPSPFQTHSEHFLRLTAKQPALRLLARQAHHKLHGTAFDPLMLLPIVLPSSRGRIPSQLARWPRSAVVRAHSRVLSEAKGASLQLPSLQYPCLGPQRAALLLTLVSLGSGELLPPLSIQHMTAFDVSKPWKACPFRCSWQTDQDALRSSGLAIEFMVKTVLAVDALLIGTDTLQLHASLWTVAMEALEIVLRRSPESFRVFLLMKEHFTGLNWSRIDDSKPQPPPNFPDSWFVPVVVTLPDSSTRVEPAPFVVCEALHSYLVQRVWRIKTVANLKFVTCKKFYARLFGWGLPQHLFDLPYGNTMLPTRDIVKLFVGGLQGGMPLQRDEAFIRYCESLRPSLTPQCIALKHAENSAVPVDEDSCLPGLSVTAPVTWKEVASHITKVLLRLPQSEWFKDPVNVQEAPDYYRVIKRPMWLRKVLENLRAASYASLSVWLDDIFLIFRNCRQYNASNSAITRDADLVQRVFYDLLRSAQPLLCALKESTDDQI
ncbi:MAG: hypothetical protein KVP17_003395 [Porospora cf. gigantea B]|uniref:uncharacterized protein n=2 Tax=Porospora cf. gigantea B TaxID=2853592 RepID=UPI003571F107|nr:MAG: hypothetical protein KVP17_003395 [Porospora cf. gigantea B]